MTTDKTGAPTTVESGQDEFTIAVEGQQVGTAEYLEREGQRIFTHTNVDSEFEERGLATILIGEALQRTRDAGLRIVAVCPMVDNYLGKHDEFRDVVDPVTDEIRQLADS
ncbi:GNAT family N-acetyltransferase [Mycolicibacterium thermoresistibile]